MKPILPLLAVLCLLSLSSCAMIPPQTGDDTGKDTSKKPEQTETDSTYKDESEPVTDQSTDNEDTEEETTYGPLHFPETEQK